MIVYSLATFEIATIAAVVLPFRTARERKNVPTACDHVAYGYCTTERGGLARLLQSVRFCKTFVIFFPAFEQTPSVRTVDVKVSFGFSCDFGGSFQRHHE